MIIDSVLQKKWQIIAVFTLGFAAAVDSIFKLIRICSYQRTLNLIGITIIINARVEIRNECN